jgi:hypothetical protein
MTSLTSLTSNTLQLDDIREKLATLESHLLSAHPQIPTLLSTIHKQLRNDMEVVTLLEDEEINILVRGLEVVTRTTLEDAVSKSGPKKKSLKSLDLMDF